MAATRRLLGLTDAEALGWVEQSLFTLEGGMAAGRKLIAHGATAVVCGVGPDGPRRHPRSPSARPRRARRPLGGGVRRLPLIAFVDLPLTTVRQPVQAVGTAAVEALIEGINGTPVPPNEYVFRSELVLRGSTAARRADDPA